MTRSSDSRRRRGGTSLLGLWAAAKLLGKTGAAGRAYAKEVVAADFEEAGDEDVFRKIREDFDAAGVNAVGPPDPPHHGRSDGDRPCTDRPEVLHVIRVARPASACMAPGLAEPPPGRGDDHFGMDARCPSRWLPELVARQGFDAVAMDMPSTASTTRVGHALDRRHRLAGKPAIVRVPVGDHGMPRAASSTTAPKP